MNDVYMDTLDQNRVDHEYGAADAFAQVVMDAETEEPGLPVNEIISRFLDSLDEGARAEVFFQLLGRHIDSETSDLRKSGKLFAIEVADRMGPDWVQGVYKFGVAVSRA